MPATSEPFASATLGGSGIVTFSSIPSTYTDLVLSCSVKAVTSGTDNYPMIRFNGDTASNYSATTLLTLNTPVSRRYASVTGLYVGNTGSNLTATNFMQINCMVMSYANTNVNKTVLGAFGDLGSEMGRTVALWRSTAAITSLSILPLTGSNFATGSTFSLYGIKAA